MKAPWYLSQPTLYSGVCITALGASGVIVACITHTYLSGVFLSELTGSELILVGSTLTMAIGAVIGAPALHYAVENTQYQSDPEDHADNIFLYTYGTGLISGPLIGLTLGYYSATHLGAYIGSITGIGPLLPTLGVGILIAGLLGTGFTSILVTKSLDAQQYPKEAKDRRYYALFAGACVVGALGSVLTTASITLLNYYILSNLTAASWVNISTSIALGVITFPIVAAILSHIISTMPRQEPTTPARSMTSFSTYTPAYTPFFGTPGPSRDTSPTRFMNTLTETPDSDFSMDVAPHSAPLDRRFPPLGSAGSSGGRTTTNLGQIDEGERNNRPPIACTRHDVTSTFNTPAPSRAPSPTRSTIDLDAAPYSDPIARKFQTSHPARLHTRNTGLDQIDGIRGNSTIITRGQNNPVFSPLEADNSRFQGTARRNHERIRQRWANTQSDQQPTPSTTAPQPVPTIVPQPTTPPINTVSAGDTAALDSPLTQPRTPSPQVIRLNHSNRRARAPSNTNPTSSTPIQLTTIQPRSNIHVSNLNATTTTTSTTTTPDTSSPQERGRQD